jgi:4-oxalmesaconate hydratase
MTTATAEELLTDVIPAENILFGSEMIGAVRSVDPETGHRFDDTKALLDSIDSVGEPDRKAIYGDNALCVFPRLAQITKQRQELAR